MQSKIFKIVPAQSRIEWCGKKITGAHNGTIDVKEGEIILNNDKLVGGRIVADTTRITVLDITDHATNAQMTGHLASEDFFFTQKFPEAILEIISVNNNHVDANLTIRGITHRIGFEATVDVNDTRMTATATLVIDRTKYDMKFRSGNFFQNLGDTLIYNDFELTVHITANAARKSVSVLV
jgi:polyisoprenoid-binding protein YceI